LHGKPQLLHISLLSLALLGPLLYLVGILTKGIVVLDAEYLRLGLTYAVLACSAACAAFLSFREGHFVWRLVAGGALLINLGSITYAEIAWSRDMQRAIAEVKEVPVEAGKVGILVSPPDHSPAAVLEARKIERGITDILTRSGLDPYVIVRHVHPLSSVDQAKELGRSMGGQIIVWKQQDVQGSGTVDYYITVLGANETEIALEPLDLMLLIVTKDSLSISAPGIPTGEYPFATQVIAPLSAGFGCLAVDRPMLAAARFQGVIHEDDVPAASLPSLHNHFATALLRLERPDLALKEYEASNELKANARAWAGIGNVRIARRDWPSAAEAFAEAVALDPYDPAAYCGLGIVYAQHHDIKRAISSFRQAIALDPDQGVPYAFMGLVYELVGDVPAAREAYRKCALHAGPHAGLYAVAKERSEYILRHPPTAVPTATPLPIPSPTPIPTSALYQVERGDTLRVIADEFDVSIEAIVELNDLADPNAIRIGQVLMIPKTSTP